MRLVGALVGVVMAASGAAADDAQDIRVARDRYNAAIAGRDLMAVRAVFGEAYVGIAGSGGEVVTGGEAMTAFFARAFAVPGFIGYVRTPEVVTVAVPAERAMERGRWVGRSRQGDREVSISGEYLAVWVPTPAGWKLRSESFVTLGRSESPAAR